MYIRFASSANVRDPALAADISPDVMGIMAIDGVILKILSENKSWGPGRESSAASLAERCQLTADQM